jgi:two-component system, NarL family, invasion response regulator UvrY
MPYIHAQHIISIAVADDHEMMREALCSIINGWDNCKVLIQVAQGTELIEKLQQNTSVQLVLLDMCMPGMDGYDAVKWIRQHFPEIKILMISAFTTDFAISRMISLGVNGYISKSEASTELKKAIFDVMKTGVYFSNTITASLLARQANADKKYANDYTLSETELCVLKFVCTDMTYKEIAARLKLSERQVDYIRQNLFWRFNTQNRAGLTAYAIKSGIV